MLKEMREWDGAVAEVRRRMGEAKALKAAPSVVAEFASRGGTDALRHRRELKRPLANDSKKYRIRVISRLW
jgi:hypothetical protein